VILDDEGRDYKKPSSGTLSPKLKVQLEAFAFSPWESTFASADNDERQGTSRMVPMLLDVRAYQIVCLPFRLVCNSFFDWRAKL
jgi:hypothetical protein